MRRILVSITSAVILAVMSSGCVYVPQEARDAIRVDCAVGDGTLEAWPELTPGQRHEAFWKLVRGYHDLDLSINDEPMPAEFAGEYLPPIDEPVSGGGD